MSGAGNRYSDPLDAAFGEEPSLARSVILENIAVAEVAQGRLAEARPLLERALAEIIEFGGAENVEALQAMRNLAPVYGNLAAASIASGDLQQAETQARRGMELARLSLPEIDARRATLLNNLAQVCRFTGRGDAHDSGPLHQATARHGAIGHLGLPVTSALMAAPFCSIHLPTGRPRLWCEQRYAGDPLNGAGRHYRLRPLRNDAAGKGRVE